MLRLASSSNVVFIIEIFLVHVTGWLTSAGSCVVCSSIYPVLSVLSVFSRMTRYMVMFMYFCGFWDFRVIVDS